MNRSSIEYNFAGTMLRRADLNPERTALVFEGEQISYREFGDRVRRQAQLLRDAGVCVGDRVGTNGIPALVDPVEATVVIERGSNLGGLGDLALLDHQLRVRSRRLASPWQRTGGGRAHRGCRFDGPA